jgi:hypothetical protein
VSTRTARLPPPVGHPPAEHRKAVLLTMSTGHPQVRAAVEGSIEELQAMREEDPLQKVIPRTILSTLEFWDGT